MSTPVLYPLAPELGYCAVVPGFLTPPECRELIALAEARGFSSPSKDYPPTYRTNDCLVHDDERLSTYLFQQLRGIAPPHIHVHGALRPESWWLDGVNEHLRFCRYTAQQQFNIHQDGVHHRAFDRRSMLDTRSRGLGWHRWVQHLAARPAERDADSSDVQPREPRE